MNWTNLTDNYTADVYRNCTVTLAKEFTNGLTILPAGSVNTSALNGKTLTPPAGRNIFITDGNWNDAANWNNGTVPGSDGDAYVFAAATITNTDLVEANNITVGTNGSITIEDGGQLIHNNEGVVARVKKHIAGHGSTDLSGWNFIATPIAAGTTLLDRAYINFEEGNAIDKFMLNPDATKLYIPQGGKDYAIASVGGDGVHTVSTEMPVNFKAEENGTYTITVNTDHVEMSYLHLIDNMTGNDVDLLALRQAQGPATYTFTAKTTDYESRFRLVFSTVCEDADGDNETFAYINNGNIIVNGEGTLQIIDVMGRVIVSCTDVARNVSTAGMTPGVYVLRLINGNDVKTQKIVVK